MNEQTNKGKNEQWCAGSVGEDGPSGGFWECGGRAEPGRGPWGKTGRGGAQPASVSPASPARLVARVPVRTIKHGLPDTLTSDHLGLIA